MLKDPAGKQLKAEWKAVKPNEVEVKLPLQDAKPGAMTLLVTQYGVAQPQPVSFRTLRRGRRISTASTCTRATRRGCSRAAGSTRSQA